MSRKTNVKKSVKRNQRGTVYESRAHERNLTGTQDTEVSALAGVGVPSEALAGLAGAQSSIECPREAEAEDVIFALENPEWSSVGFTHDSNWYAHKIMGRTPEEAKKINKGDNYQPIDYDYWTLQNNIELEGQTFNWEAFPAQHFTELFNLFESTQSNPPINHWDVSNITNMASVFEENHHFNQPLNRWDVSNVTKMESMFSGATAFNQPLDHWDVSRVADMNHMFYHATKFNRPLDGWDTANLSHATGMFEGAKKFNQNLGSWDITGVEDMTDIFYASGMTPENLSLTLQGWAATARKKSVNPDVHLGTLPPTANHMDKKGKTALRHLREEHGWIYWIATRSSR